MILWRNNPETKQIELQAEKMQHLPNAYECGLVLHL